MTQLNTDLTTAGITSTAWRGKWNNDVHTQTRKKPQKKTALQTQMADNNLVGKRLPQWLLIERVSNKRLRFTNSTNRDVSKNA